MRMNNKKHIFPYPSDLEFLEKMKRWLRSSMEFSVSGIEPKEDDLVFLYTEFPVRLSGTLVKNTFYTLGEIVSLCEESACNTMIYEAWVDDALRNIYSASNALNLEDRDRLISFFKIRHDIFGVDEEELSIEAGVAIREAQIALYGG